MLTLWFSLSETKASRIFARKEASTIETALLFRGPEFADLVLFCQGERVFKCGLRTSLIYLNILLKKYFDS